MATIKTLHSLGAGSPMADPRLDQLARARAMILGAALPQADPSDGFVGRQLAAARERERAQDTSLERALLAQQGYREQRAHDAAQRERDRVARALLEERRLGQQGSLAAERQREQLARQRIEDQRYHTGKDRQATLDDLNLGFRERGEARQIAGDRRKAVEGRAEFFKEDPLGKAADMAKGGEAEGAKATAAVDALRRQAARFQDPLLSQEVDLEGMRIAELVDQARRQNRPAGSPEGMGWLESLKSLGGALLSEARMEGASPVRSEETRHYPTGQASAYRVGLDRQLAQVQGEPSAQAAEYYNRGARPTRIPVQLLERINVLEAMAREGDKRAIPKLMEAIAEAERVQGILDSLTEQGYNLASPTGR